MGQILWGPRIWDPPHCSSSATSPLKCWFLRQRLSDSPICRFSNLRFKRNRGNLDPFLVKPKRTPTFCARWRSLICWAVDMSVSPDSEKTRPVPDCQPVWQKTVGADQQSQRQTTFHASWSPGKRQTSRTPRGLDQRLTWFAGNLPRPVEQPETTQFMQLLPDYMQCTNAIHHYPTTLKYITIFSQDMPKDFCNMDQQKNGLKK